MNILVLSNYYPPHHIGGYGMLCLEVVNGLIARGHQVTVLAGMHGVSGPTVEGHVQRRLTLESDLYFYKPQSALSYPKVKRRNLAILGELVTAHKPDIIFVWGMWALSKEVAGEAERLLPGRVVYYLANPWPIDLNLHRSYWDALANTPLHTFAKRLVRLGARVWLRDEWKPFDLQYEHALCCSEALRDQLLAAGTPLKRTPVIYEGIDLAPYLAQPDRQLTTELIAAGNASSNYEAGSNGLATNGYRNGALGNGQQHAHVVTAEAASAPTAKMSMLFVGTLAEHKGVHTTLEALAQLTPAQRAQLHLTILGSGHPHYEARLHGLVEQHALQASVTFHAPIPRAELPAFLGKFAVLLLPSIWEEPLARIMQEGMAGGMVVVGAATGGTKEIIRSGENGLLFPGGDGSALAAQLRTLLTDPYLRDRLAKQGRQDAIQLFAIDRMVAEIEEYLCASCS